MSKKYIKQIDNLNFVYPNNVVPEYDVEVIQNINDNSVSGTISNFTGTSITYSAMTFSFNYTWLLNDAEPFVADNGQYNIISVHSMLPNQLYYKPWRMVDFDQVVSGSTSHSGTMSFTINPSDYGISAFVDGIYYFEVRFIGKMAILPVCVNYTVSGLTPPTPTPTPTATVTPPTPTPTPTPSGPTPTPTPSPTITAYNLYLADEYACTFPGCALQRLDVVVALPTSFTPQYGKFYPDEAASGFAYLLTTTTSTGPGIILNGANFTACNSACAV